MTSNRINRCRIQSGALCALTLIAVLLVARSAIACNVPVFRYALEKWPAGKFEVFVFYKGKLTDEQKTALQLLRDPAEADPSKANLNVEVVDLANDPAKEVVEFYESLKVKDLPVMTVLYPVVSKIDTPFWTAPLNAVNVKALLQSPARKRIADEILKGTSAVWIVLNCGDKKQDDAAGQFVAKQLTHFEKTLKLPKLTDHPEDMLDNKSLALKLKFSMLTLDRDDPAEAVLVKMLLHSERDKAGEKPLRDFQEPMAFAVYGRGRATFVGLGQGLNEEYTLDSAKFVIGPCTCKVKEQNPGFDLLMNVAWESELNGKLVKEVELPPLTGIAKIKLPAKQEKPLESPFAHLMTEIEQAFPVPTNLIDTASAVPPGAVLEKPTPENKSTGAAPDVQSNDGSGTVNAEKNPAGTSASPKTPAADNSALTRNTLFAIAGGIGIVALVYVVARVRGSKGN